MHLLDDLPDTARPAALADAAADYDLAVPGSGSSPPWRGDAGEARVLVYTAPPLELELEIMSGRVVGQIVPPGPGQILVETSGAATFQADADDIGFFELSGLPRGSVRLRCETPAGRLVTDWICL